MTFVYIDAHASIVLFAASGEELLADASILKRD